MPDELSTEMVKQAFEPVSDLVKRIAGPLADEIGGYLGAIARPYRVTREVKAMQKTKQMLKEAGIAPQAVPPRLLVPILEGASIEDDEDLHSRWAALLANACASPNSVHPSFIEILRQLAPDDAHLLDRLYDSCKSKRTRKVGPWVDTISYAEKERRIKEGENPEDSFQNLIRLALIQADYEMDERGTSVKLVGPHAIVPPAKLKSYYELSDFAVKFVKACRAPKTIDASTDGCA